MNEWVLPLESLGLGDVARVGGKNASLGEMIRHLTKAGVRVPGGFATTATAFHTFLDEGQVTDRIRRRLAALDVEDVSALAAAGREIRGWISATPLPKSLQQAVGGAFHNLESETGGELAVAVRSSATAEDLPEASFAGQQETYLNVRGLAAVLEAVKRVYV